MFQYEILFCIQDKDDPANEVVNRLMAEHPNIEAKIVTGRFAFDALLCCKKRQK